MANQLARVTADQRTELLPESAACSHIGLKQEALV